MAKKRVRLDDELVAQGWFANRDQALRAVLAGEVSGGGERFCSPATLVAPGAELHVKGKKAFVSRGGVKLDGALEAFGIDVTGLACVDVGCSTGGFTHCLLARGAARVLAVDVGYAQFAWELRGDARVELLERTNIVEVPTPERVGTFDLAVCDVSFTSVTTVLPAVRALLGPAGQFVTLVKPQFEAPASEVGAGGVVRDASVQAAAIRRVAQAFEREGLGVRGLCASSIAGHKGNHEFLLWGQVGAASVPVDVAGVVALVHEGR